MLDLDALFAQPDNAPVLAFLRAERDDALEVGRSAHPMDEGGSILHHDLGRDVPHEARCVLSFHSLLVHPRTARIFAFNHGRFTIAVRTGDPDGEQVVETLDGTVDLRPLGPGWTLCDGGPEEIAAAYALSGAG